MEAMKRLFSNRWSVLVGAIWMESWAGIGYVYGSISPVIKSSLKYNQKQINTLGVAKDIGDALGLIGGSLTEVWPGWAIVLLGALQNLLGYGLLWLLVAKKVPELPFWMVLLIIGVGTNGETNYNTVSLVSCVKNFPRDRGPIVGILKGFTGLCGAILTQYYATLFPGNQAAFILMVAIGPAVVGIALMFAVRTVGGSKDTGASKKAYFHSLHAMCLILAAYLLGVMLLQDFIEISRRLSLILTIILVLIMISPSAIPLYAVFKASHPAEDEQSSVMNTDKSLESPLLGDDRSTVSGPAVSNESTQSGHQRQDSNWRDVIFSELEDEKPREVDLLPERERRKRLAHLEAQLVHAAAEGAVRVKRRRGPRRGENFTLMEAIIKADFWLLFFSLVFGAGSGLTVIDNLGQISQSKGFKNSHIFVSLLSIWNFLGRILGGYLSEVVARDYAYPRPVAMAASQITMAIGHVVSAMSWSGSLYAGTLLLGVGYGAHWGIIPATVSEVFGLKNFGVLYNFFIMANPAGSLFFSGVIAGSLYDWEAEKQHNKRNSVLAIKTKMDMSSALINDDPLICYGQSCFFYTFIILSGVCIVAAVLSMIVVYRTRLVYYNLYHKNSSSTLSLVNKEEASSSAQST
eukprot:TRINITY_DN10633_c0_g1_i1.p1 TRINITY_DN10633_c0_g1~~TRINITY_DN10633_c0_g1_i1.p1  ORF type:complete len:632 (+),score=66.94 TRINITY_DN10633_c0_g1_i1:420-2315(+)